MTPAEIEMTLRELAALDMTPLGSSGFRMALFRAVGKRAGIKEREAVVAQLHALLDETSERNKEQT